ncbi:acetyl-CoA carboxylase biotin carboxyl carrier protein [Virgisporangium ochraceum]|uniref:Biotin carboxyl carrier protein of acetyl-CoA carboxylase n=1 Tax=Virgisporangium ochraceum TaxID=65505 RepID=A0A8J3ZZ05_9ACTN|nr:biotin/lipoyl-containing protein [Virgisporangium ochraceum]GIJ72874.1 acetyl-CoA carboxylase biotin carboxyl carrier protein subunit [Virgisporangium ochraceum]
MTGAAPGGAGTPSWSDVLALVAQLDASGIADAEVVSAGVSVRVSRTVLGIPAGQAPVAATGPASAPATGSAPAGPPAAAPASAPPVPAGPVITAPMLGVLYHRPGPDQPPFVAVGDTVTPDTTVAIIEVMKLMNPVSADVHGVIAEVCVPDATAVEHGDVLFRLQG